MADKEPATHTHVQLVANIYKSITVNIIFSKRQQWAITNYTILIYGAIFGLNRSLPDRAREVLALGGFRSYLGWRNIFVDQDTPSFRLSQSPLPVVASSDSGS